MINTDKKSQRRFFIEKRKQMSLSEKKQADDRIFQTLVLCDEFRKCENLLCYVSTPIEVATHSIIEYSLSEGKNVFVPRCADTSNVMTFHRINSLCELEIGMYGISEPSGNAPRYNLSMGNTVCIVPALSFNHSGMRLGYGKGYYDRFLSENENVFPIGLCYHSFLCDDIPVQSHDKAVKLIITEQRIIKTEV